jgi:hypothetical protein
LSEVREQVLEREFAWRERKEFGEVVSEAGPYFVEGDVAMEEFFEGGGFAVGDAAGNDEVEVAEVGGDVVGEAVGGDPPADVDTDGGEFFFGNIARRLDPDAGFAGDAVGGDAEVSGGADHGLFESADIPVNVAADGIEIEDGVANDLAGAVIGDVATAVGFAELDIFLAEDIFGGEKILLAGVAAEGENVGMLAEEEDVVDGAGFAGGDHALLEGVGVGPGEEANVANEKGCHEIGRITAIRNLSEDFSAKVTLRNEDESNCSVNKCCRVPLAS